MFQYVVNHDSIVVATAITIIQIKAGATTPLELIRVSLTQEASETSTQEVISIVRKTVAATVTAFTPLELHPDGPAADAVGGTSATGITATGEGTDGDLLIQEGFNILNGWLYLPVPEERIFVPAAGMIALKFAKAPSSATWTAQMVFQEFR